jgi:hypothetical protein
MFQRCDVVKKEVGAPQLENDLLKVLSLKFLSLTKESKCKQSDFDYSRKKKFMLEKLLYVFYLRGV